MDPPAEGCPLCGSTWGNYWRETEGRSEFFCCEICADQWETLGREIRERAGWSSIEAIEVEGNRWGRTISARSGETSYRCFVVFTPEGVLRRFDELPALLPLEAETTAPTPAEYDETPGLHPKLRERLESEAERFLDVTSLSIDEGRAQVREVVAETDALAGGPPAVSQIKNTSVGLPGHRVPARVYFPDSGEAPYPVVVYFHGGGWVFGDLDTHDSLCREIANRSACVVLSVAYRRAPEHKFPEALEDCLGALRWVADPKVTERLELDPTRVVLAGDSAGATMATVVAIQSRDEAGPRVSGQILLWPVTAYLPDNPSYRENAEGMGLEGSFMPWMWEQYLRSPEDAKDPRVAPLLTEDLSGLPPALVITAECDILRDEGEQYAHRLQQAGVTVHLTRYPGMIHGFIDYRGIVDDGWKALDEIGEWLRTTLVAARTAPAVPAPSESAPAPEGDGGPTGPG